MKKAMIRLGLLALAGAGVLLPLGTAPVNAWERGKVELFAVLPEGATGPEGIAVGRDGNVYVTTFGFNAAGGVGGPGKLYVFNPGGYLIREVNIAGSTANLLGMGFHPSSQALLVVDFGAAQVLRVDPTSGSSVSFMTVPTPAAATGLNDIAFDAAGNVYVSDSFQGIIWKTGPGGGLATAWVTDSKLATPGVPPFGANGLDFNKAGSALLVANTGSDQIIRIPVTNGSPGAPEVFVNSINGADGLVLDRFDNIWVAANQADEIVVLDPTGKVVAKLGDFSGLTRKGMPQGFLFPATPAFSRHQDFLYVTNLALDIRLFGLAQAVDSQWAAQVKRYTISKIRARIPSSDRH
jgi:sugar lactone lactonase YvrE